MKLGTKSVLFGVHQFIWHPITVYIAWLMLYRKLPSWRETVCIIVHDWGYWGKPNMDGPEGEAHPVGGALIAKRLMGDTEYELCLCHSRHYARTKGLSPSKLCWADKACFMYDPWWLYLPRAWLTGELAEYRKTCSDCGFIPITATHRQWWQCCYERFDVISKAQHGDAVPYTNSEHKRKEF